MPYVLEYKFEDLYPGRGTVRKFWCNYLEKGVFTLVARENGTQALSSGTKCEQSQSGKGETARERESDDSLG